MAAAATRVVLAVSSLLLVTASALQPSISFISGPEVVANVGEKVELECRVENGKEYPINWIKIREERGQNYEYMPLSTGKTLAIRDNRFKILYDSAISGYTLQINDIQDIDAAKYECQVIVGINNKVSKAVNLQVRMPPIITTSKESLLTVVEGTSLDLNCTATGFPTPKVEWRRRGGQVLPGTSATLMVGDTFRIERVRREDRGDYICSADNRVGRAVSKEISIEVRFGPRISVPRPRVQQAVRYGVIMVCEIEAFPTPAIDWFKGGVLITNEDNFSVVHFTKGPTLTSSSLKIPEVEASHYGTYECKASNAHGKADQKLELVKTEMPIPEATYGASAAKTTFNIVIAFVAYFLVIYA